MNEPDLEARIADLRHEARSLPRGRTKVSILEEAVRLADVLNDVSLAYRLRDELMDVATFTGRDDLLLVAFSWCLARFDEDPTRFSEHSLLWKYKWVVGNVADFPEISRQQIEDLLDDMERRFAKGGYSLHAVLQARRAAMIDFGEPEKAKPYHAAFRRARRDWLSNCSACVASSTLDYHVALGNTRMALQTAAPLIAGTLVCTEEPRRALGKALLPLLRTKRLDEARRCHEQAYRLLRVVPHAVNEFAQHLRYVTLAGELAKARRMLERHLPAAVDSINAAHRFAFFLAARLLMDRLRAEGAKPMKLRLPDSLPQPDSRGRHDLDQLGEWFTEEARRIGARYDARNGTDSFRERLDDLPRLLRHAVRDGSRD